MPREIRLKFEPGHRLTFVSVCFIAAGALYVIFFLFGLMTFACISGGAIALQKLGWLDANLFTAHRDKFDGDMFLYVVIPLLGLLPFLLWGAIPGVFRRLTQRRS